jgi:hypothetical protein
MAYERIGATGTQSCSPVGAGGWTGCAGQFINNYYAEKKQQTDVHFSQMIEAEREKRAPPWMPWPHASRPMWKSRSARSTRARERGRGRRQGQGQDRPRPATAPAQ